MAEKVINDLKDLVDHLNDITRDVRDLRSDLLCLKVITPHLLGILVRQSSNPEQTFSQFRTSSRENLSERTAFEGGSADTNQKILDVALDHHDQIFEEIGRALGLRKDSTQ